MKKLIIFIILIYAAQIETQPTYPILPSVDKNVAIEEPTPTPTVVNNSNHNISQNRELLVNIRLLEKDVESMKSDIKQIEDNNKVKLGVSITAILSLCLTIYAFASKHFQARSELSQLDFAKLKVIEKEGIDNKEAISSISLAIKDLEEAQNKYELLQEKIRNFEKISEETKVFFKEHEDYWKIIENKSSVNAEDINKIKNQTETLHNTIAELEKELENITVLKTVLIEKQNSLVHFLQKALKN